MQKHFNIRYKKLSAEDINDFLHYLINSRSCILLIKLDIQLFDFAGIWFQTLYLEWNGWKLNPCYINSCRCIILLKLDIKSFDFAGIWSPTLSLAWSTWKINTHELWWFYNSIYLWCEWVYYAILLFILHESLLSLIYCSSRREP